MEGGGEKRRKKRSLANPKKKMDALKLHSVGVENTGAAGAVVLERVVWRQLIAAPSCGMIWPENGTKKYGG